MDPHLHNPASNPSNREVKSGGIPWNGVEEEEDEGDWSIDQSSADDDYAGKEPQPYSRLQFDNLDTRNPKNQHLYAEDMEDDEEDELGKGDEEDDDEDDDGIDGEEDDDPDWDDNNRQVNSTQEQLEQPQQQKRNGSSQTDTSGEGDDGRNYYIQNEDEMYVDRLNAQEGVGGEEEFESPTEENHDQSGDQTEQEVMKAEEEEDEEQGEESGYNDLVSEPLQEQGILQDEDKDASERILSTTPKTPGRGVQKRKSLSSMGAFGGESSTRKPKKKNTNVWTKTSSRKGGKKNRSNGAVAPEETAFITPVPRLPDKVDDSPDMMICLSKIYKAEKVELSEDRLTAASGKGYRMVRATRGVIDGAWYFEIKIVHLGETGHTRLGWSTEKGDVQAPVGYDGNSYSYRDVDGSKVHKAVREPYGDGPYCEGDVIGFYINLPDGANYAPRPPQYVLYRGQIHCRDSIEEPTKIVPGSEISFFKNGICQGVAFKNINAGRYYPAASMYTLPYHPICTVRFNFGPQFDCFPEDFGDRPLPKAMYEAPYCGIDGRVVEQGESLHENGQSSEKKA